MQTDSPQTQVWTAVATTDGTSRSPHSPLGILRQASPRVRSSDACGGLRQRRKPPHPAGSPSLREAAPTGDASGTLCERSPLGRANPPSGLSHRRSVYRQLWATHCLGYINQVCKGRLDFIRLQSSLRSYRRDFSRRLFLLAFGCTHKKVCCFAMYA